MERSGLSDEQRSRARQAIEATQRYLFSIQQPDGHWCGELEGDTILESEYMLTMHFIGKTDDPKMKKAANNVRRHQLESGGWSIFPGGPPEVSASVKAYFVLKLVGDDPEAEHMRRARREILELGGIEACNSFTKLYLAIYGQYDWEKCPAVLPEIILLPRWFYINIYEMSSWSRAIIVPLSVIRAHRPHCPVPERAAIPELYSDKVVPPKIGLWSNLFHALDRGLRMLEHWLPVKPTRAFALKECEKWILERLQGSDGLGAIFPPIVNTIIALRCLGYPIEHPTIQGQIRELEKLEIEEDDVIKVQPCFSPTWDTALAVNALVESGLRSDHPDLQRAGRWLLGKRGIPSGDWRVKVNGVTTPGWYFEYANPYYPDCDTTSQVITALSKVELTPKEEERKLRAIHEGHEWHVSMQNEDGGWGAFDKGCDKEILCHVPFADHNAMIDPSTSDLTARGLETLAALGYDGSHAAARRAVEFLLREQEEDGSWYGRWGCNYLYGTWLALWGLKCIGRDVHGLPFRRAAAWLEGCQNEDGGWGELPLSYEDPSHKGRGPSTPSQTAWAVMGLLAADEGDSAAVRRGVEYLIETQESDGSWEEEFWTGTGFPSVFYLRYHLYRIYFPLLALATYCEDGSSTERHEPESVTA
jgi:squalene-hopene/tetraprenyl-beta-curcumene cyclase